MKLLSTILTHNYGNIRYDLTISIIFDGIAKPIILNYFDNFGLIYLLERINPDKIRYYSPYFDYSEMEKFWKRAKYIYSIKTELRLVWMSCIIKIFFDQSPQSPQSPSKPHVIDFF